AATCKEDTFGPAEEIPLEVDANTRKALLPKILCISAGVAPWAPIPGDKTDPENAEKSIPKSFAAFPVVAPTT
uniref:hypothetical protein n=1 Tax=Acinetobacter baumannii TaxID=470 RepID=UPI001C0A4A0B